MEQGLTLSDFLAELDRHPERVPLGELRRRMEQLELDFHDIESVAHFGPDHYQRNLLHAGSGYHALVLCWRPGQRSPIHNHSGSSCGVRVIKGTATETIFEQTAEGLVFPTQTSTLPTGGVTGSQDTDIHQVSNLQPPGEDLVTLHIYSPPLAQHGRILAHRSAGQAVRGPDRGL